MPIRFPLSRQQSDPLAFQIPGWSKVARDLKFETLFCFITDTLDQAELVSLVVASLMSVEIDKELIRGRDNRDSLTDPFQASTIFFHFV